MLYFTTHFRELAPGEMSLHFPHNTRGGNDQAFRVILWLSGYYTRKVPAKETEFRQFILKPVFLWLLFWFHSIYLGGNKVSAHRRELL